MNTHAVIKREDGLPEGADFTPRQREVLAAVLDLMVEEGDGFSLAKVCRRASCSKETLYNWFGDRDGLLTATVQWQASKVKMPGLDAAGVTAVSFRAALTDFAISWLEVITSDVSAALNRLAVSHAGAGAVSAKGRLGEIVLENGPLAMRRRLKPMLAAGEEAGLLAFDHCEMAIRTFFGLVVADWQIRKLLGEATRPSATGIQQTAERAVEEFLLLYGAGELENGKHG
ncbi:MAG: TetR/AcrR family transcriptional regulator C-terminal domain-containing protein [Nitratireductor sp.]|nr:TetR/AcrR family transcriptional regulator C-terminal domain-containing protein [Nitratireductor sp.]